MTSTTHPPRRPSPDDTATPAAVVRAVAEHGGSDPLALPPLHRAIDPDALADLFASTDDVTRRGAVSFAYADHRVEVAYRDGDRSIEVRPRAGD